MKKAKKLLALSVSLIMSASLFTGCSKDGLALVNALGKSQTINSMQSQTDISVKVSGANMSEMEQQMLDSMLPMINGTKLSMVTKTTQNEEKTIAKMQSDISLKVGQMPEPINMGIWVDADMSKDEPVINEMFKIPELLSAQLPKGLQGKEYMVLNLNDMSSAPGVPQPNYKKLMSFSKEMQPKYLDFIVKYAKQFNPPTEYIKYVGSQTFIIDNKRQSTDTYEVKLTDKSFKDLIHYTLNNLAENTEAIDFVQEFMTSVMSVYGMDSAEEKSAQEEMNKAFGDLKAELPKQLADLSKALHLIDDLKILGDNGIKIQYTVNNDGYIINKKGSAEFVVDLPSIMKLAGSTAETSNPGDPTGIYTIVLDFNTDITNINGDVEVVLPKVDSSNSFDYNDIMKMISTELPTE